MGELLHKGVLLHKMRFEALARIVLRISTGVITPIPEEVTEFLDDEISVSKASPGTRHIQLPLRGLIGR